MDVQAITNLVSTLGYPIVVSFICFWFINKTEEKHKEETDKLTEAIHNNTLVMQKLVDKLGVDVA